MPSEQPNCIFFLSPRTFCRSQLFHTAEQEITIEMVEVMYDADNAKVYGPGSYFSLIGDNMHSDIFHAVRNGQEVDIIIFQDEDTPFRGVLGRIFAVVVVCPTGGGRVLPIEQDDVDVFAHLVAMYVADEFIVCNELTISLLIGRLSKSAWLLDRIAK
ncbi:hypothetical protein J3R83DRAFT_12534 [Lanmaoa asiatica]|nr:hypothetical protein J3R83DRAFT_12534 [Lanmaoa asiatica]